MISSRPRSTARLVVLAALVAVLGLCLYFNAGDRARAWLAGDTESVLAQASYGSTMEAEARAPVGPSPWIEADKKRYLALLRAAAPEIVVLPYQIAEGKDRLGIDISARMIMAHSTAQRVGAAGDAKVADVEFVARALGEPRRLTRAQALSFARDVGAQVLLYGTTSHDGSGRLAVSLAKISVPDGKESLASVEDVAISDAQSPELAFRSVANELLARLGYAEALVPRRYEIPAAYFPANPADAFNAKPSQPLEGIWIQHLLASLHAGAAFREGQRIHERTLAALETVSPDSPDYRLLTARALMALQRRPAALAALGTPHTPEEVALHERMKGNLPELAAAIEKIRRPLPRLLAKIDLLSLGIAYDMDSGEAASMAEAQTRSVPEPWQPVLAWNGVLRNRWLVRSTIDMKLVLDAHFPLKDHSLRQLLGTTAMPPADGSRIDMNAERLAIDHVHKYVEQRGSDWCCVSAAWQPRPYQYLGLLGASSVAMLLHQVERSHKVHGQPQRALRTVEQLNQAIFEDGHVQLHWRTMAILHDLMFRERSPDKQKPFADRLLQVARQVRQWETADAGTVIDAVSNERTAMNVRVSAGQSVDYPDLNDFKLDFPPTYNVLRFSERYKAALNTTPPKDIEALERACHYTLAGLRGCVAWHSALEGAGRTEDARAVEREQLLGRFHGNPYMLDYMSDVLLERGAFDKAQAYARANIASLPKASRGYMQLGYLYLRLGDYDTAQKVYLSYAPFIQPGNADPVALNNDANWVGRAFAQRGRVKDSRRFFEIAASLKTGAAAQYDAERILAYMDGRFADAAKTAKQAARHYANGSQAYEHIALLFARGETDAGWTAARDAITRYSHPGAWYALPVAFRMAASDPAAVLKWAVEASNLPPRSTKAASENALRALTITMQSLGTDRDAASFEAIARIRAAILPEFSTTDIAPFQRGQQLDNLDRFAAGYAAFKRKDYEAAWNTFQKWTRPGSTNAATDVFVNAMPYHAYAAAKTGRSAAFGEYLAGYDKPLRYTPFDQPPHYLTRFDVYLAHAVLAAADGNHAEAARQLARARAYGQAAGVRVLFPAYVYAEICELLAADSARREYIESALALAKASQVIQPWDAWAYAFEARHGTVESDRARAYAIARYLDPQSFRLRGVEERIARQADRWLASHKPFGDRP